MTAKTQNTTLAKLEAVFEAQKKEFRNKYKRVYQWMEKNSISLDDLRTSSQQFLAASSMAGAVAMNQPVDLQVIDKVQALVKPKEADLVATVTHEEHDEVINKMQSLVKLPPGHLDKEQELYLEQQLTDMLGFEVTAELEDQRLNHSIGIMGGEQHLYRFAGDSLSQHDAYQEAGIAPNRGAFGWFTEQGQLTEKAIQMEKYYFAVQTLYLPDWNSQYPTLKPWYKFRKMIVINPAEKVAVVGVVGDAGPAQWVQKQFGGSPEIIREAKIWSPESRGRVMLLFVDDPNDEVPLGVINLEYDSLIASQQNQAEEG